VKLLCDIKNYFNSIIYKNMAKESKLIPLEDHILVEAIEEENKTKS